MTISSELSRSGPYLGNGTTTVFPYGFKITDQDQLWVVFIDALGEVSTLSLEEGDYSVTGVGEEAGGDIQKSSPLMTGQTLTIVRRPKFTQETSLENQGPYYPSVIEDRFDLLTMQIQSVREATDRSLSVLPGQPVPSMTLIAAAEGFAQAAAGSRDAAAGFAGNAFDHSEAAEQSATLAQEWASLDEDAPVVPGKFSSYHWAQKALAVYQSVIDGFASAIQNAPAKLLLKGTDLLGIADSEDGFALKQVTIEGLAKFAGLPIGTIIDVYGNGATTPPGYIKVIPDLEVTSATPELRAFGLANGWAVASSGNPKMPSGDALFKRQWSAGQTRDAGRVFGSVQEDALQNITGTLSRTSIGGGLVQANSQMSGAFTSGPPDNTYASGGSGSGSLVAFDASRVARTAAETRPANLTVTYYIKAYAAPVDQGSIDVAKLVDDLAAVRVRTSALEGKTWVELAEIQTIGTTFDFTNLPATVHEIEIDIFNILPASAQALTLLVFDASGTVVTAGYASASGFGSWGSGAGNYTNGFIVPTSANNTAKVWLRKLSTGWIFHSLCYRGAGAPGTGLATGHIAALDRLTGLRIAGASAASGGAIKMRYRK